MKKLFIVLMIVSFLAAGCYSPSSSDIVVATEQEDQLQNQASLSNNQKPPSLSWSLERQNLIERVNRWNDPNKVSYIYLLSDNGVIMGFFAIKGKVSSLNSYLTGSQTFINDPTCYGEGCSSLLMESPDYDGSYGDNGQGVFFFLTDGTYMEWNGMYLLADQPLKLSQQPVMVYDVTEE